MSEKPEAGARERPSSGGHVRYVCTLGWERCDLCNRDAHPDLFLCTVCGGAEASLPTQCPGRRMTPGEEAAVQAGEADYRDDAWTGAIAGLAEGGAARKTTSGVRIWLDDLRPMPPGYDLHVTTAADAKAALARCDVSHISFDHDLGPEEAGSGYQVAAWIEEAAHNKEIPRIQWRIHSANPVGRANIERAMRNADRFWAAEGGDE